ncbi:hypothetical protein TNCV_5116541 [Trichonephila clavipes]|nr:hypothetical protein TNCV_5116541 [Trichonephila clavipes]
MFASDDSMTSKELGRVFILAVFKTYCAYLIRDLRRWGTCADFFRSSGQSDAKLKCSVPKQAWYSFIDPLRVQKAELTLHSPGFEPRTCGVEAQYTTIQPLFWTTAHNPAIMTSANRTKKDGTKEEVPYAKAVVVKNDAMGGVDHFDQRKRKI